MDAENISLKDDAGLSVWVGRSGSLQRVAVAQHAVVVMTNDGDRWSIRTLVPDERILPDLLTELKYFCELRQIVPPSAPVASQLAATRMVQAQTPPEAPVPNGPPRVASNSRLPDPAPTPKPAEQRAPQVGTEGQVKGLTLPVRVKFPGSDGKVPS